MTKLSYEKPSLKKYGNMKELTFGAGGSPGDAGGLGNVHDTGPSFGGNNPGFGDLEPED